MLTASPGYGQGKEQQRISLDYSKASLATLFEAIEKKAGLVIMYENTDMMKQEDVQAVFRNRKVAEVMDRILQNKNLKWSILGRVIRVERRNDVKNDAAEPGVPAYQPVPPVRIYITSLEGQALAGASVINRKTNKSGITDAKGMLDLEVSAGDVLVVSYVGYATREITVKDVSPSLRFSLQVSDSKLDEIQVIAYGTTSRRLNTGAVTTVKAADIEKQPVGNPIIALSGRVPGLSIQQTTGVPGAAVRFNIRGLNSISGANDPFIIIDGVPFNSTNINMSQGNTMGAFGGASALNSINTADIESIEVLKDADATAIYGSRGANGVILITTKKGKSGKTGLNVNIYQGIGKVSRKLDLLDTRRYLDMRYEAFANDGVDWRAANVTANDLKLWDTTRYTDWQDVLVGGTAKYTSAQVGLSGGNQHTQFTLNGSYWKETSVFPGEFRDWKLSGRFGVNHRSANDRLRVDFSTIYTYDNNLIPSFNPFTDALSLPPNAPALYKEDGSINWEGGTFYNPIAYTLGTTQSLKSYNLNSSALFSYRLFKSVWLKANTGYSKADFNTVSLTPKSAVNPFFYYPTSNKGNYATIQNTGWNAEPYLEYETKLYQGKLSVMLGSTFQEQVRTTNSISASDFLDDKLMNNPASAKNVTVSPTGIVKYRYNAVFGRLNYNFQNKYIANLTMRRDGSSRFGPGRQFGNFGAVGLAWIFSEEGFAKRFAPVLSYGKLRASYGITGSDAIGDYAFLSTYSVSATASADRVALKPDRLYNPDYGWESNKKMDIELELGFLENRLMLSVNYYRNRSSNQLVGIPMPAMTGFTSINSNLPATVQNTGLELTLNTVNIRNENFSWNTSFNLTVPRNKLVAYPNLALSTYATSYVVGYPLSLEMLYDYVGVNSLTGVNVYRDRNGKDTSFITSFFFTQADRTILVNTGPRFYGGISNELQYRNFRLDIQLVYSRRTRNNDIAVLPGVAGRENNITAYVFNNSWRNPGEEALFPKFTQSTTSPAYRSRTSSSSEAYFTDTYYLRLNNLSLSWTLPQEWQRKLHASNARVYLLGQNLLTFTNFKGVDPETGTTSMPLMRVMTAGVQFNL
ncbi:SusC/RagA family TonB-linked outer membrane protein [Chitinophaga cymbidii]|uniref:SusC/RagA family TonB-linked outer membrane protein n=1 Tax=Chitinophaga cymbidii TaxID=1096750 RepID=A0A512RPM7_9BACT|nr:SusC/RagA family TonB-linked outer membrane protein [Chitinophaga cymbidii]